MMATTDRDKGDLETGRLAVNAGETRREVEEPRGWATKLWQDKQFLVIAVLAVSGIGLVASLYIVPWGDSLGNRGIMLAGTWLFLISGLIWLGAFIALTWWLARDVGNLVSRLARGIRRLAPNANPQVEEN